MACKLDNMRMNFNQHPVFYYMDSYVMVEILGAVTNYKITFCHLNGPAV